MIMSTQSLLKKIYDKYPNSNLVQFTNVEVKEFESKFGIIPEHYKEFLRVIGHGTIGDGNYALYGFMDIDEVYDSLTATGLNDVVLIGDDFSGCCDAFRISDWILGTIDVPVRFEPNDKEITYQEYLEFFLLAD